MGKPKQRGPVPAEMSLPELAEYSGVAPRTIRLYIAEGVLSPPLRAGRNAAYGREHLDRLTEIRQLQAKGLTLAEIRIRLGGGAGITTGGSLAPYAVGLSRALPPSASPAAGVWVSMPIAEDVILMFRGDAAARRQKQIFQSAEQLMSELRPEQEGSSTDDRQ